MEVATVLDLDRRIRDFPIPDALRTRTGYESRGLMMQKGSISTAVEAGQSRPFLQNCRYQTDPHLSPSSASQIVLPQGR
jgi:hypothetical protein